MLKIDKNFENYLIQNNIKKMKIFFFKAGCAGLKIGIDTENFEITNTLEHIATIQNTKIFADKNNKKHLENAFIVRTVRADHTGVEKIRYIYTTEKIKQRCGCGTSFSFEPKKIKLNIENLKTFQNSFKQKSQG